MLGFFGIMACGDERLQIQNVDLVADRGLEVDGIRLKAHERFSADETWVAVTIDPGRRVTADVQLHLESVLTLVGAVKCSDEESSLVDAELSVEVEDEAGGRLSLRQPIDRPSAWWRRQMDLSELRGRRVRLGLEARLPEGCRLLLREASVRQMVRTQAPPGEPPLQIVLLSVDTLRRDAVGAFGGTVKTPHLDEFTAEAEKWTRHYAAASWTKPSHASMLTGFHPDTHRALNLHQAMDPAIPTLAERFRVGGFVTSALVYDCGWLSPRWGFAKGFDSYRLTRWRAGRQAAGAAEWILDHRNQPFFFFVHTFEPHSDFKMLPYEAPGVNRRTIAEEFGVTGFGRRQGRSASSFLIALDRGEIPREPADGKILRATYEAGVRYLDESIAVLFEDLKESGVWDQLLIVVTSDHGEEFDEHGGFGHGSLYEEIIAVPLLIKWPHSERAGVTNGVLSSSVDLAPTLLEYAGLPTNDLPGANLRTRSDDDPVFSGTVERAVLTDRFKGIFGGPHDLREVFDLSNDPGELDDLAARDRQRTEMLRELLRHQRRQSVDLHLRLGSETTQHEIVLSEHERERLRAFGYLQ
jgi:arylsulfatase A-like enzyme